MKTILLLAILLTLSNVSAAYAQGVTQAFVQAVSARDATALQRVLKKAGGAVYVNMPIVVRDVNILSDLAAGNTALHWAIIYKDMKMAKVLLANHADIDVRNGRGYSAFDEVIAAGLQDEFLLIAVQLGFAKLAARLIEKGANVEARERWMRRTPLMETARRGHVSTSLVLLDAGADINAINLYGRTPLMYASLKGHLPIVEILLEKNADTERVGFYPIKYDYRMRYEHFIGDKVNYALAEPFADYMAVNMAAYNQHWDIVVLLVEKGAKAHNYNSLALHWAAYWDNIPMMKFLRQHGADADQRENSSEKTPLFYAYSGETVELLATWGANVNATEDYDESRVSVLMSAAWDKEKQVIEALIDLGAEVNFTNEEGRTPLHEAVHDNLTNDNRHEVIAVLLANGANPYAQDKWGDTPLAQALELDKYNEEWQTGVPSFAELFSPYLRDNSPQSGETPTLHNQSD